MYHYSFIYLVQWNPMILSIYIADLIHAQLSDCDEYLVNQIVSYSPLDFPEEWLKLPLHCHFRNQQGNYLFGPQLAAYQDHTCCFIFKGFTFLVLHVELVRLLVIQGLMRNFWDAHPSAQTTATMHAALVHLQGFQFSQHIASEHHATSCQKFPLKRGPYHLLPFVDRRFGLFLKSILILF